VFEWLRKLIHTEHDWKTIHTEFYVPEEVEERFEYLEDENATVVPETGRNLKCFVVKEKKTQECEICGKTRTLWAPT